MTSKTLQASPPSKLDGLKAAIFDLDGVVLSTQLIHAKAWRLALNDALGYLASEGTSLAQAGALKFTPSFDPAAAYRPFTHQDYLDHVDGKDRSVGADCFLKARGLELHRGAEEDHWRAKSAAGLTVAGVCRFKNDLVNRMFDQPGGDDEKVVAFASTIERIRELKEKGVRIAAASSSRNATKVLKMAGVYELFDAVVCGLDITDPATQSKPAPYLFLEAAKRVGAQAHESMVVEDAQCGVQAGRDGGFRLVVGLSRDPQNHSKLAEYADVVVSDLQEIGLERIARLADPARSRVLPWDLHFSAFEPAAEKVTEVLTALGNGYLGQRSSLSSLGLGRVGEPAFYVAGLFNKLEGDTADLVNLPGWSSLQLFDGADWVDLAKGRLFGYSRKLSLRSGELFIDGVWEGPSGRRTRISVHQFLSHDDPHVGAVRFQVTPLSYQGVVQARLALGEKVTNAGATHLRAVSGAADAAGLTQQLELETTRSGIRVRQAVKVRLQGGKRTSTSCKKKPGSKVPELRLEIELGQGESLTLDKQVYVSTSRPGDSLEDPERALARLPEFEGLAERHRGRWREHWDRCDVRIEGDLEDQQAIRFMGYHLCSLGHRADGTRSIGAKGLSNVPGGGYRGHVFWDTELFMLQFFTFTAPEIARELLLYRYRTLPQARAKALQMGYQGALYAWESADTGAEETPLMAGGSRVWCGEIEHHISAAVAYAADQYARVTGDRQFATGAGAEILLETARFWASRAQYDPRRGRYSILQVIGPDEFHEGVDDSVYTNLLARWNIRRAIEVVEGLSSEERERLLARVQIPGGYPGWEAQASRIAEGLKVDFDPHSKLFEQFEGYFGLVDPLDCPHTAEWIRPDGRFVSHAMDGYLKEKAGRADRAAWTQINKQADVVMMLYLLDGAHETEVVRRNFAYYAPRTSHGSSLSNAIHAIVALRASEPEAASRYFKDALITDLGDEKGNSCGGIHAAALGGAWQAVVNGFGGVSVGADGLRISPELRETWSLLSFRIRYQGVPLEIRATREAIEIEPLAELPEPLRVQVGEQELFLRHRAVTRIERRAAHLRSPASEALS